MCNESFDSEIVFSYLVIASYSSKLSFCQAMDLENKETYAITATYLHKKCETCYIWGKPVAWWKLFWKISTWLLLFYFHPLSSFFFYFMYAFLKKTAKICGLFYHLLCIVAICYWSLHHQLYSYILIKDFFYILFFLYFFYILWNKKGYVSDIWKPNELYKRKKNVSIFIISFTFIFLHFLFYITNDNFF